MLEVEVVHSFAGLESLAAEWCALAMTLESVTPFQLPSWLLTWWRHFGSGQVETFAFRVDGRLVGIVPCFLHEWQGRSQLTLIGSGISDYLDPLIAPGHEHAVVQALSERLRASPGWEICDWQDLSVDTPLREPAAGPFDLCVAADTPCSAIRLTGTFEELIAGRSKDLRRNLRRYGQRADQAAPVEVRVNNAADATELSALIQLHAARWEKQGEPGMIQANGSEVFVRDVAREFDSLGMLRLFTLRFDGQIVAVSIGFLLRNVLYSYLSAFHPQYEILGFGRRLVYESLRYAFDQGYESWNFCRGEEAYKFSWGAEPIPKCRVIVRRASRDKG